MVTVLTLVAPLIHTLSGLIQRNICVICSMSADSWFFCAASTSMGSSSITWCFFGGRQAWLQIESQDVCRISAWSNVAFSVSTNSLLLTQVRPTSSSGCVQCRPLPRRSPSVVSCAKENMTFVVPCSNLLMRCINYLVSALAALSRLLNLVVSAWLATNMFKKCWHCSPVMVNGMLASAMLYFFFVL